MAREDLHFRLRIPEDLKKKVEKAADANHRSMTAEIIARLEASFHALRAETGHFKLGGDDVTIHVPTSEARMKSYPPDVRAGDLDKRLTAIQDDIKAVMDAVLGSKLKKR